MAFPCAPSPNSKKLPSLDNEVSTVTDTIDILITAGNIHAQVASCHEILNLTIPFRELNNLSRISLIQYELVIFKRVLLGDSPVKEFQSPISKCDACVRSDGGTQPLVNSGRIAVLRVVVCFGVIRWGPFIFHWGRCYYFYSNSNSNWRYITDPGTRKA